MYKIRKLFGIPEIGTWYQIPYLYEDFGNWHLGVIFFAFIMKTEINTHKIHPIEVLSLEGKKQPETCPATEGVVFLKQSGTYAELYPVKLAPVPIYNTGYGKLAPGAKFFYLKSTEIGTEKLTSLLTSVFLYT